MTKVRAPMLLDGNMQEVRRLEPSGTALSLNLVPPSTADMTIPFDVSDPVPMRSWVRLYNIHGDVGVYRVSASDTEYENNEQRLTLEHGITSLRDKSVPSLPDAGANSEVKKTASEMLAWLLGKQDVVRWTAGSCAATENVILDQNGSTLFEMLLEMMEQLPEYDLSFNQSSYPWTVSIVSKAVNVTAEGRLSRNLESVRVTYDDSELCTRVWYNIKDNDNPQHMDASTIGTYGIVDGSLYLNTDTKKDEATRIATRYLEIRKEPAISVEITAVDLSVATGEQIDAFTLGKKFRLTIPAYGLIVNQWITGLRYSDVYGAPEHVTITLGNRIADIAQRAAKTAKAAKSAGKSSSGGGAGGVRNNAAEIKRNEITLETHDEYITALDDGISVWREDHAGITIGQAMVKLFASQRDLYGDLSPSQIKETLRQAGVTVDANKSLVELFASMATTYNGRIETSESRITANEKEIDLRVKKTDYNGETIVSYINQTATTIKIHAQHIDLEGYVTANNLASSIAAITSLGVQNITVSGNLFVGSGKGSWQTVAVVTKVTPSTSRKEQLAIANDQGNGVVGATSFNYVSGVTVKKRDLYFLGQDTGGEY